MLSLKFFSLITVILLLIFIGLILKNTNFLLITIPIFIYTILLLILDKNPNRIIIKRDKNEALVEEDSIFTVKILIEKNNINDEGILIVKDNIKELELYKNLNFFILSLKESKNFSYEYKVYIKNIGKYIIGPINFELSSISGIYNFSSSENNYLKLLVAPKIFQKSRINFKTKYLKFWPGESISKRIGIGNEFYGIQSVLDYSQIRRINWKATAKTNVLMKNVYHSEVGGDILIIVDYRNINNININGRSLVSYITEASLFLSFLLLMNRYRVGMVILGDRLVKIPFGVGKKQYDRILYSVLDTDLGEMIDIRLLSEYILSVYSYKTQIIIITPAIDEDAIYSILDLYRKGYSILGILPSPIIQKKFKGEDIILDIIKLEREIKLFKLKKIGIFFEWNIKNPLISEIKKNLEIWQKYLKI